MNHVAKNRTAGSAHRPYRHRHTEQPQVCARSPHRSTAEWVGRGHPKKNALEEIRVELSEYNGHDLINVRIWTDPRDGGGERIPTKAGICCRVALLPELIQALHQAEAAARAAGLLP